MRNENLWILIKPIFVSLLVILICYFGLNISPNANSSISLGTYQYGKKNAIKITDFSQFKEIEKFITFLNRVESLEKKNEKHTELKAKRDENRYNNLLHKVKGYLKNDFWSREDLLAEFYDLYFLGLIRLSFDNGIPWVTILFLVIVVFTTCVILLMWLLSSIKKRKFIYIINWAGLIFAFMVFIFILKIQPFINPFSTDITVQGIILGVTIPFFLEMIAQSYQLIIEEDANKIK